MNRNITAVILIVLAIGIYFTFTKAKLAEVKAVQVVNAEYLTAIENADKLIEIRDKVLQDYNNLTVEDRERMEKMIPNTVDNIRLIIDLNSVALRHGFSLRNITASASDASGKSSPSSSARRAEDGSIPTPVLDTVSVSFNVTAPYQRFIDLLRDLEANLRIMDVTHLSVSAGETSGSYDFSVGLNTYWLRQQ